MAPGTNTGAASPVLLGQTMDPVLRSKMENDLAALLRSLTARRGRNSELAEKAVQLQPGLRVIFASGNKMPEAPALTFCWKALRKPYTLDELSRVLDSSRCNFQA